MRRWLLVVAVLIGGLSGCSYVPSVVQRGYGDFTSYFNTFYNAKKAFEKGQRGIQKSTEPIDRTVYLSLFPSSEKAGNRKSFKKAIEKSASILRDNPNSRWVDDALLLIGKSYFYLQNYVGAQQKFEEVIALGEGHTEEANFWLARTFLASGAYEEGVEHLQAALQREDIASEQVPRLHLVFGQLYVQQGAWRNAIDELQKGVENTGGRTLRARSHFLLGQLYEKIGQYGKAAHQYRQSADRRPRYELAYAAQVSAIRVQGLYGDAEAALRVLRDLQRDDKNYENRSELSYLQGRIAQAQGRPHRADRLYRNVLYRSKANVSDVRPLVQYAMGKLYRDAYGDYVKAAAYFDTAATALEREGERVGAKPRAPAAISDAQVLHDQFGQFSEVRSNISRMDSLLRLGKLDEETFRKKIIKIQRQKARRMAKQKRARAKRKRKQAFQQAGGRQNQRDQNDNVTAAQAAGEAGFLFHENPIRVQQARVEFRQRWGNRPLVDNWRRLSAITAVADEQSEAPGGVAPDSMGGAQGMRGTLPAVDISGIPRDASSRNDMIDRLAQARYKLGNVLFLQMQRPDSAAAWYRRVITENGDRLVADRAYYALAEVQRARGDTAFARKLYQKALQRNPDDDLADRLRRRLGRASSSTSSVSRDTLAQASAAYAESYETWKRAQFSEAIPRFLTVADRYSNTPIAPKALLAAGQAALEWSRRDSLALTSALPLVLSDTLRRILSVQSASAPAPSSPDTLSATTPDSLSADSMAIPDSLAHPDSSAQETAPLKVTAFYKAVTERYPQSPQAGRAQRTLRAIQKRTAPADTSAPKQRPVADTTAGAPSASGAPADTSAFAKPDARSNKRKPRRFQERRAPSDSTNKSHPPPRNKQRPRLRREAPTDSVQTDSTLGVPPETTH